MHRLITFGDSFTWGSELGDILTHTPMEIIRCPEKYPDEYQLIKDRKIGPFSESDISNRTKGMDAGHSLSTWPALLAKHFNLIYHCHSTPGGSNQTIIRQLVKLLPEIHNTDLIVIDWTFLDRWEYVNSNEVWVEKQWKTLTPTSANDTEIGRFYFKHIQSELWNKWESLKAITLAKWLLKSNNIKYFMTCEDPLVVDEMYHSPNYIKSLQKEIKNDIFWFDNKGFCAWANDNKFPLGKLNNHPLEEAHQAAFEYIINNYEFT